MDRLITKLLSSPVFTAWLKQQLNHLKLYETIVRELNVAVESLKKARDEIQNKVDEEEKRYGREIPFEVKEWIEKVDEIIFEYEDLDGDQRRELAVFDLFKSGYLPKPGIRYRQRRKANKITKEVNGLLQTAKQHEVLSYWLGPPSMTAFFNNFGYERFPSRDETIRKIKVALKDTSVRMIGLYGLIGVGKTTLVKEVAKEALKAKNFDVVIMANVSRDPDIRKIQGQIADMMGMKLDEESDIARAARIRRRLKNEKESTLIILDDLWGKMDFSMLGILYDKDDDDDDLKNVKEANPKDIKEENPTEPDNMMSPSAFDMKKSKKLPGASNRMKMKATLSRYKGCKVLLISEAKQVLLSQMEGHGDSIFYLEALKENEAETLFKKMAGIGDDNNSEYETLAAEIANKCKGLTLSIVTTAKALKNQSIPVWEDVHRQLERQKLIGGPEFSTKLSYGLLENEELKYTFLLCACMAQDPSIMELVKNCIGLGFLQGVYTVREVRDRVYALVGKLKESGLLSDTYLSDHFTMQDIVRNAALSIASEENKHVFTMTKGKIYEWPDVDKLQRYATIFLQHCDISQGFPTSINYPRLRVLHVNNNDPCLKIPEGIFEGMKELNELIMTGVTLSPIPSSITFLMKLRMLCLEQCMLGGELSIIGELENLRILSLSGSDIEKLPDELKKLTKLQIFDISNCSKLTKIPSNVISSLNSLEELYMTNTLIQWEVEGHANNASLSELRDLNQLTVLDIQIPDVAYLPKNLFFDKLYSYKIVIGDLNAYSKMNFKMPEKYETSRFLAIQDDLDIHSHMGIKILFDQVENLLLGDLNGVQDIFYRLNLNGFPYLKQLSIVSNSNIQSLVNPMDRQHPEKAFPKLESLHLYNLENMVKVCSCEILAPSFGKLRVIKISLCGQLKNIFSISMVKLLTVLETIEVSECNSLKEVVPMETQSNNNEIEPLNFPELRSLTLQSLYEFIGFYPISSAEGETRKLFHEKVVVSKLEKMELSSIRVDVIWSDQPLLCSYFQSLIHLDVNGCNNLKYLLSFSMAKSLVNLQSLFVSECEKMGHIFRQRQDNDIEMKGSFPNLKNIKLSSMKSLSEIWNSELALHSFGILDTLIIEECNNFINVFPCYMKGIFSSLCNLRVTDCKLMKAIFELDDQKQDIGNDINLQDLHLEALPKLKCVWKWNKDRKNILKLNKLQKIFVHDCNSLENIVPISEAMYLDNLEKLVVTDCLELREIITKREGTNNNTSSPTPPLVFAKLSTIQFSKLSKLKSFYPGARELSFPSLNDLSVELCDKLEPFRKEMVVAQGQPVVFPEEVINKLKSMQIESWHAKSSRSYMGKGNYRRDNLEELHLSRLTSTDIVYSFLHSNPNLKILSLIDCSFKEMVPLESPSQLGVVPKLKVLKLINLPYLEKIGFESDIVLQRIEFLIVRDCPCLVTTVPSSVSLIHLTSLEVVNCEALKSLMSPSTAKSLGQLRTMKVIKCKFLREIVSVQRNEEENVVKVVIVFKQMKTLELVSLKNLKSFCKSRNCAFEFPSLEKLVVSACPKMEKFSEEVKITPILQKIYVIHEKEKMKWYWDGNLEATIRKMFEVKSFFEGMDGLNFSDHLDELLPAWRGELCLQNNWFYSLKSLKLDNCIEIQPQAVPSNILRYLKSLIELEVRACNNVEVIFDMNGIELMATTSQLKKLTLLNLPKLEHVWKNHHQGILCFQNLQQVSVSHCEKLKSLFPVSLAKNLKKLETLQIGNCVELPEIVKKDVEEIQAVTEEFVFPCLTFLHLSLLNELTCFYPETFTLECPVLHHLYVLHCDNLELFQNQQEPPHPAGEGSSTSINTQPLFSDLKTISDLKELWLDWKHTSELMRRLGQLTEGVQNLSGLSLSFGLHITYYLGPEISWPNANCEKLSGLYLHSCSLLTTLVPPEVSFSYLKELFIFECHGLKYLFTSSVANRLMLLEEIRVEKCDSMETIVEKEPSETSQEIKFERLDWIALRSLSSLDCFYSGSVTLLLPSLIQVDISLCPNMKVFSRGSTQEAKFFRGIKTTFDSNGDLVFHDDPNLSVEVVFLQQVVHLVLEGSPLVLKIWHELEPVVPDRCFGNLNSLVVEGCEFLSNAVLPSHLLCSLINLKELQVQKCNSVKAIFDHTTSDLVSIPLKKLILDQLPILEHVWNRGNQGSLSLPHLEEVLVDGCTKIKSLFPASVAKDKLQKLEVKNCDGLEEIVAKDEAATEEVNTELIIFQSVTLLRLWKLPNLRCIYPGMHILKWPMLKELDVLHCQMLSFFATEFQNSPDSHPEDRDSLPTDQQASVSLREVTPHLKTLCLGKEEAMMIELGKLHIDLQLWLVKLQSFKNESDVFPFVFLSNVSVPQRQTSIEKIEVVDSAFEEIFPSQRPDTEILSQPKELKLQNLPRLNSIGLEHSWMVPILENLETFYVWECMCLTILTPSIVSFSNLKVLDIKDCHGLKYLFTSSTAKNLGVLKEMHVSNCQSIEEILETEEGDESNTDIVFEQLQVLTLHSLPALGKFYSGSSRLNFPSLKRAEINVCDSMEIFCNSYEVPKALEVIKHGFYNGNDLNSVIREQSDDASGRMRDPDECYDMVESY
ncbi:disease resistance protein [Spatholobus suberectus]|nr:disease resistance protein [Spatholobus suberectus]